MALVVLAAAALAGCGSTGSTGSDNAPSEPVPQEIRDLDVSDHDQASPQPAYDQAFTTLEGRCNEQGVGLANEVGEVLKLLKKGGVDDETRLTVMQHMAASVPQGQKMGCADVGAAYVTLRTG